MPCENSRRDFLKTAATVGAAALALGSARPPARPIARHRARAKKAPPSPHCARPRSTSCAGGIIGLGERGGPTLEETLLLDHCEVTALCDTYDVARRAGLVRVATAGRPAPAAFGAAGPDAFLKLLESDKVDAVFICTPWREHTRMAVAAMRAANLIQGTRGVFCRLPEPPLHRGPLARRSTLGRPTSRRGSRSLSTRFGKKSPRSRPSSRGTARAATAAWIL